MINRRQLSLSLLASAVLTRPSWARTATMTVFKSPTCGCCNAWIDHIRAAGIEVTAENSNDMGAVKQRLNVPQDMWSCHTGVIDGYVIEGHVPATDVARIIAEKPDALGLAVPGMPVGSPGMEMGDRRDPYTVWLMSDEQPEAYASYGG